MDKKIYCDFVPHYSFHDEIFFFFFSSYILFHWGQKVAWADTKGQKMNGIEIHDVKDTKNKKLKK